MLSKHPEALVFTYGEAPRTPLESVNVLKGSRRPVVPMRHCGVVVLMGSPHSFSVLEFAGHGKARGPSFPHGRSTSVRSHHRRHGAGSVAWIRYQ